MLSVVSISVMPAVNSAGKTRIDQIDRPCEAWRRGNAEQADLGRSVEAEAEQDAERKHLPAPFDQPKKAAEQAPEQAAVGEHEVEVFLDEPAAALDGLERAPHRGEDDDVGDRDGEQEQRRHQRADHAAEALERLETTLKRRRGERDGDRQRDNDRRMAEREKQPDPDRAPAFLHELAGHVVDRRDVIGVERVSQTETVGERGRAEQQRIGVEGDERPQPCGGVEDEQEDVDRDDFAPDILLLVIEEIGQCDAHSAGSPLFACRLSELGSPRQWFERPPYCGFSGSVAGFQLESSVNE